MAIKLAFSTLTCPEWTLEKVVEQAKAFGYAGVELATLGSTTGRLASDPALIDPAHVRQLFAAAGLVPVGLTVPLSLTGKDNAAARSVHLQALHYLELAQQLGCPLLNLTGPTIQPGQNFRQVLQRVGQRTVPLAQRAGELGVQIVFENGGDLPKAREWWWLLELVNSAAAGLCWNVATAAAASETSNVSVPMLHSRIRLAKIGDFKAGEPATPVQLGDGVVGAEAYIKRLLGIGYHGFVSVAWNSLRQAALPPDQVLPEARQRIQAWLDAVAQSIEDAKPKPKPAKPHAPGPAAGASGATAAKTTAATKATPAAKPAPAIKPVPDANPAPKVDAKPADPNPPATA